MSTKIVAARLATSAGVTTVIARSANPGNIVNIVRYVQGHRQSPSLSVVTLGTNSPSIATPSTEDAEDPLVQPTSSLSLQDKPALHTRFLPSPDPIRDRHFWLLHGLAPHGTLYIDTGAHRALLGKAGLLPAGVVDVEGNFAQQEAVRLVVVERLLSPSADGKMWRGTPQEVGRALVNYAAPEIARIKGQQSVEIGRLLGYADSEYVAQREYVSFFRRESRPVTPSRESGAADSVSINGSASNPKMDGSSPSS